MLRAYLLHLYVPVIGSIYAGRWIYMRNLLELYVQVLAAISGIIACRRSVTPPIHILPLSFKGNGREPIKDGLLVNGRVFVVKTEANTQHEVIGIVEVFNAITYVKKRVSGHLYFECQYLIHVI